MQTYLYNTLQLSISIALSDSYNADELVVGIAKTQPMTMEMLEEIIRTDDKQRYSFNPDKTLIRANQGHSIPVDVELKKTTPPALLFHGTGEKYVSSMSMA